MYSATAYPTPRSLPRLVVLLAALGFAAVARLPAQTLDDPTRPYRSPASSGPASEARRILELNGVLVSSNRRIAVINGDLYREGDTVNGALVVRIDPRSVHLKRGDQTVVVEMSGERPKPLINRGEPTS